MFRLFTYALVAGWLSTPGFAQSAPPDPSPDNAKQENQVGKAPTAPSGAAQQAPGSPSNRGEPAVVPKPAQKHDPQTQCVKPKEFAIELKSGRNPVGDTIVFPTNFLATNQRVDVGVRSTFVDGARYFAGIDYGDGDPYLMKRQDVVTRRAVESDALVKKRLLDADQTIVTLNMGDDFAWFWSRVDLYLYTCNPPVGESPARVSVASVRLSPYWLSLLLAVVAVVALYVWAAFVLRTKDHTFLSFVRGLSPAKVSAGADGKASLATFQTLSFSLVVVGLILFFMLQTGILLNLSGTVLALLGISGVGSTIARGADAQRTALSAENRAWLLRRNWIPAAKPPVDPSNASWSDFFSTDGVFDVYRYQSFIFALLVIGSLIAAGATELSTFAIPETILGIVGLSQMVYIGGKFVTQTNMSDLNAAIADLRDREKKLRDAATAAKQGAVASLQEAIPLVGQGVFDAYKDKARDVAALFTEATGFIVSDPSLDPKVMI
jgi:hypothetical protein